MLFFRSLFNALGYVILILANIGNAGETFDYPGLGKSLTMGILLYEGWEPLDVIGPYEIIMNLSYFHNITLSLISDAVGPVTTQPKQPANSPLAPHNHMIPLSALATHTYSTAPKLDILLVPGGVGLDIRAAANNTRLERFVSSRYKELQYLLSVCTGARVLAGSGVLNGKRATTNKSAWDFVTAKGIGENITWVPSARWTTDGKVWTSSGVSAGLPPLLESLFSPCVLWQGIGGILRTALMKIGMDLTYAFTKFLYGSTTVDEVMDIIEYAPHTNPEWDPFSVVYKVPGANMSMDLKDCVGPVGT